MSTRIRKLLAVLTSAVGAVLLAAAPAAAGPLSTGGVTAPAVVPITATSIGSTIFYTDYGVRTSCSRLSIEGEMRQGTPVVARATIGTIHAVTFGGCTTLGAQGYPVTIQKPAGTPDWTIVVAQTPAPGAPVDLQLHDVALRMHSTGTPPYACDLTMSTGAIGSVAMRFDPATQRLTGSAVAGVFPLSIDVPTGITCGGQFFTGDQSNAAGTLAVSTGGLGTIGY